MTPEEWENLCDRCGGCCDIGDNTACPKLDTGTMLCTIYKDRSEIRSCVNVTPRNVLQLHKYHFLPDSCAYVRWAHGLEPKPKEYRLIPFIMGKADLQKKFWELQKVAGEFRGQKMDRKNLRKRPFPVVGIDDKEEKS